MGNSGRNIWLDGIMGVVVGDALGVPYEFLSRDQLKQNPAVTMRGNGTYDMPAGTWSDDSSMTLAALASIRKCQKNGQAIDFEDIMDRFKAWKQKGDYTPYGEMFDIGGTTLDAICRYEQGDDIFSCGGTEENDNGNGSLMRIMPFCLYAYELQKSLEFSEKEAISLIHLGSGLTHNHIRSKIACGLYYFCICAILDEEGSLMECLQSGINRGWSYYKAVLENPRELYNYNRCRKMTSLKEIPEPDIYSGGYVVASFTASFWSLLNSSDYAESVLRAVNLGWDTDTTAAITGGLAGLYYGYEKIPKEWLGKIARRDWIEGLCGR